MRPVALIVEWQTPDLLDLCLASLTRFAPDVQPLVLSGGPGPEWHARAIEKARPMVLDLGYDPVILLDTDTVILSERWWEVLDAAFNNAKYEVVGGHRSRGEASQMFDGHWPKLHASMLAMRRHAFEHTPSFAAEPVHPDVGLVTRDTAWQVIPHAESYKVVPFFPITEGRVFPGLQVGEYYDTTFTSLWSHLWRGTGMPAGGPIRQAFRKLRAACGSESAKTVERARLRKEAWMKIAWEVVRG